MKSKLFTVLVLLTLVAMVLSSCAPKATPTPKPEPTKPAEPTAAPELKPGWSLEEASKPWRGQTLQLIGEALPPLEALEELKHEFEEATGVKV